MLTPSSQRYSNWQSGSAHVRQSVVVLIQPVGAGVRHADSILGAAVVVELELAGVEEVAVAAEGRYAIPIPTTVAVVVEAVRAFASDQAFLRSGGRRKKCRRESEHRESRERHATKA